MLEFKKKKGEKKEGRVRTAMANMSHCVWEVTREKILRGKPLRERWMGRPTESGARREIPWPQRSERRALILHGSISSCYSQEAWLWLSPGFWDPWTCCIQKTSFYSSEGSLIESLFLVTKLLNKLFTKLIWKTIIILAMVKHILIHQDFHKHYPVLSW